MAASVQACISGNSCKHSLKTHIIESPRVIHRSNKRNQYNPAHRRSAVERLEESKANYVKSECVLDSRQEFEHSSHLQVSKASHIDVLLSAPAKHSFDVPPPKFPNQTHSSLNHDIEQKFQFLNATPRPKSPAPPIPLSKPVRRRARSQSEIKDSQSKTGANLVRRCSSRSIEGPTNLEIRLKQLISSSSKENILSGCESWNNPPLTVSNGICTGQDQIKIKRGFSDPLNHDAKKVSPISCSRQPSHVHKSLPDLSPVRVFPLRRREPISSSSSSSSEASFRFRRIRPRSETFINEIRSLRSTRAKPPARITDAKSTENLRQSYSKLELSRSQTQKYSSESYKRRPVFRSKSDITYVKQKELFHRRSSGADENLQSFFDMIGLEHTLWYQLTSPETPSSPPKYFDSATSIDSVEYRSSFCSDDSSIEVPNNGANSGGGGGAVALKNLHLKKRAPVETSIVEKNARVVKWLYLCKKAHVVGS